MAKFAPGQIVSLRSGRIGKIIKVSQEAELAYQVFYLIQLNDREMRIHINGLDVMGISDQHHWNRQKYGLTDYESDVLDMYTGPTFRGWNKTLREGKPAGPEINALQNLLSKSPKYTGYVYRGLSFKSKEEVQAFGARFTKGVPYTTPQFMSTSRSNSAAKFFQGDVFGGFMRIYTNGMDGAVLREFTGTADLGENEVLFRFGTIYDVVSAGFSSEGKQFLVELTLQGAIRPAEKLAIPEFRKAPVAKGPDKQGPGKQGPGKGSVLNKSQ